MQMEIRPLEPALLHDFLDFFDDVAFTDHQDWSWCYCTYYLLGKEDEQRITAENSGEWTRDIPRNMAIRMIKQRELNGYLAYLEGNVVGWCNAGDKKSYKRLCENREIWDEDDDQPIKSVTCFIVAPDARRQGIASALLHRVAQDAQKQGYLVLEAYPASGELDCYAHYHGHPQMYLTNGFTKHKELHGYCVYRKLL